MSPIPGQRSEKNTATPALGIETSKFPTPLTHSEKKGKRGVRQPLSPFKNKETVLFVVLIFFVFFTKPFDTARRINQLLFPCEEGMTLGTNFDLYIFFG
jgi:hypothetical protein